MVGISIWQLLIIALLIAPFIMIVRAVRKGAKGDLRRPLRFLNWSFMISVVGMIAFIVVATSLPPERESTGMISALLMLPLVYAGWAFWVALAVLARRLKRSPIVWVGLAFITSPIGPFVAYFMMRSRVAGAAVSGAAT